MAKHHPSALTGIILIELLIVIGLCALIGALLFVPMRQMSQHIVRLHAHQLYASVIYLQQKALLTQYKQELYLDTHAHAYHYDSGTWKLPHPVRFGAMPGVAGPPAQPDR
jgi:type II secretory pathway pseudopilin PulG